MCRSQSAVIFRSPQRIPAATECLTVRDLFIESVHPTNPLRIRVSLIKLLRRCGYREVLSMETDTLRFVCRRFRFLHGNHFVQQEVLNNTWVTFNFRYANSRIWEFCPQAAAPCVFPSFTAGKTQTVRPVSRISL